MNEPYSDDSDLFSYRAAICARKSAKLNSRPFIGSIHGDPSKFSSSKTNVGTAMKCILRIHTSFLACIIKVIISITIILCRFFRARSNCETSFRIIPTFCLLQMCSQPPFRNQAAEWRLRRCVSPFPKLAIIIMESYY